MLRHAKAEPAEFGTPDFDRPLIKRGRDAAKLMGQHMRKEDIVPDRVLCSPSARTRETLERVMKQLGGKPETLFPDKLYNAPTGIFIEQIREYGGKAKHLLVVGHNPATEEALAYLTDPSAPPAPFPTGALAIAEFDLDDWSELTLGSGRLAAFVKPRDLGGD